MNWVNVAMIISVIAMFAVGAYFLVWMTSSQKRAAAEYREQMSSSAAGEAREPDESEETRETDGADGARPLGRRTPGSPRAAPPEATHV